MIEKLITSYRNMMNTSNLHGNKDKCFYCGREEVCTKDRVYPKSKGGMLLVWACNNCQHTKAGLLPHIWLNRLPYSFRYTNKQKIRIKTAVESLINKYEIYNRIK